MHYRKCGVRRTPPEALGTYQKAEIEKWWPKGGEHQSGMS
jgi:hypothetical protein